MEMLDWRRKVFARMDLVVLGFQGGGEWGGSEIDRMVTRHPRTLVVHDSCAQRVSRRQGTRLSGAVLITSLPIDIRHFAQDVLVQIRYAHRCLSSAAYRAGTLTTSDRGCRVTDLTVLNHATPRHPVSTQNQQIHFHHRAAYVSPPMLLLRNRDTSYLARNAFPTELADHSAMGSKAQWPQTQWRIVAQRGSLFDRSQAVLVLG